MKILKKSCQRIVVRFHIIVFHAIIIIQLYEISQLSFEKELSKDSCEISYNCIMMIAWKTILSFHWSKEEKTINSYRAKISFPLFCILNPDWLRQRRSKISSMKAIKHYRGSQFKMQKSHLI